jgi:hypothetical protein
LNEATGVHRGARRCGGFVDDVAARRPRAAALTARPHVDEVRDLKKQIKEWRKIFRGRYLPIRHQFAHKKLSHLTEVNALLAKTNVEELKRMFGFLRALHQALHQLFLNGLNPTPLPDCKFVLPPEPEPSRECYPGEDAYSEAQQVKSC